MELLSYIKTLLYQGFEIVEIQQQQIELCDRIDYFAVARVCHITVLYMESPLSLNLKVRSAVCNGSGICFKFLADVRS